MKVMKMMIVMSLKGVRQRREIEGVGGRLRDIRKYGNSGQGGR